MEITHGDMMRSSIESIERFAKYVGATCARRSGESDGSYKFRLCAAVIRTVKKMRSRPKDQ